MQAQIEPYGTARSGEAVDRITIADGIRAEILTYGGVIARLDVPRAEGGADNVVLGLGTLDDYEARSPSFGATIGRYANRIGGGRFKLDGVTHELSRNEGGNTLHGGAQGFGKRVWQIEQADAASVTLRLVSEDGEAGFPGRVTTSVRFSVTDRALRLDYTAETDRPTVINLTNHSYFNLLGEGAGDAFGHSLQLEADHFLELDQESIPTGRILDVAGTPFDFRAARTVGERVREAHEQIVFGLGYDACFVFRGAGMRRVATVAAGNGRVMAVWTDQPAVQLYSANKLTGALVGPSGRAYRSGDALCLETQHYPDAPNHAAFPSTVLRPGTVFRSATEYVFTNT